MVFVFYGDVLLCYVLVKLVWNVRVEVIGFEFFVVMVFDKFCFEVGLDVLCVIEIGFGFLCELVIELFVDV